MRSTRGVVLVVLVGVSAGGLIGSWVRRGARARIGSRLDRRASADRGAGGRWGFGGGWVAPAPVRRAWRAAGGRGPVEPMVVRVMGGVGAVVLLLGVTVGPVSAALVLVLVPPTGVGAAWAMRHRRDDLVDRQLPGLLDAVARAVRAGHALPVACRRAFATAPEPLASDGVDLIGALDAGASFESALGRWVGDGAAGDGAPAAGRGRDLARTSLLLAARSGGAPARALDGVAATMRERDAVARESRALTTQARLSGMVIAAAPVVFAAFVSSVDAGVARFLLGSPAGWMCLAVGLVLDGAGALWMTWLTRRTVIR